MPRFDAHLDLNRVELRNAVIQNLASAPSSPDPGLIYYDTTLNEFRVWNGTGWDSIGDFSALGALAFLDTVSSTEIDNDTIVDADINSAAAIALSKLATDPLARANHTGTQTASTISDFDTQVRTSRLDQMATPTAAVDFGSQQITGLASPTLGTDAANRSYVDGVATGLDVKASCRVASTADVTVSAPGSAIDGVTLSAGDRVLLKDQSTGSENGIYDFDTAATPMTRSSDADEDDEVTAGMFTFIAEGTVHADQGWVLTTNDPITVGSTALSFSQFSAPPGLTLPLPVADGGTGATTAAGARTNLAATTKYTATFGDGASTSYPITHNLGTLVVSVNIYDTSTGETVYADVTHTDANTVTVDGFASPPASNSLTVVVRD